MTISREKDGVAVSSLTKILKYMHKNNSHTQTHINGESK